ncbi:uncharacterized protein EV154DRAFT_484773 [Mucor mucedo]|uniref:uncharacterized protein n=1 Tax=Mucor mucedo TaxID=29922 RepID=UPI00221ED201|nr:uncharacterized protein EV154DRAFT_484773 [Mucor mucedo]KAI7887789.1 hypothetical protein EV154DRAFT_484773 [Mucor mucedo]
MLISKHWYMVSRTIIYRNVTLREISQFELFVTSMFNSSSGQLVKQVELLFDDKHQLELNLGRLFKSCPNITSLKQAELKKGSFYAKLLLEVLTGSGTKLKRMPAYDFTHPHTVRKYGHATYALKDTLEHIHLCDYSTTKATFKQNETLNQLPIYKNLKSIKKHLGIAEPFHLQPLFNVRSLKIGEMLTINSTLTQYVLHLFPNVKSFKYADGDSEDIFHQNSVQQSSPEEWERMNTQGIEIHNELWIQFLTLVASMTVCTIPFLFVKDVEVFSKVPNLYENLHIIMDERTSELDRDLKIYYGIFYNTTGKNNIRNMHQKDNYARHIVLHSDRKICLVDCPKINAIKALGPNLKALDFDAGSQGDVDIRLDADIENSVEGNLFDLISDYCPYLDTLWVADSTFHHKKQHTVKPIQSLERIKFRYCKFDEDYLCQLSSRLPSRLQIVAFINSSIRNKEFGMSSLYDVINMPNTSFSTLLWKSEFYDDLYDEPDLKDREIFYIKLTKNKTSPVFYKISTNNQLAVSSFLEFETSKGNNIVQTIDIRCFDIKMLAIKLPFLQSLLRIEEQPIICDDKSYMDLPDFSLFYSDF